MYKRLKWKILKNERLTLRVFYMIENDHEVDIRQMLSLAANNRTSDKGKCRPWIAKCKNGFRLFHGRRNRLLFRFIHINF